MKKTILTSMALCLALNMFAQQTTTSSNEKTRFGIKLGGQISAIGEIHGGSGKRFPGITGGIMMQIPLQKAESAHLFFTPELLYSQEGEKNDNKIGNTNNPKFYQDYLALPLMFKYYLLDSKLFYLELGPKLSYMINQKEKDLDKQYFTEPNKFDVGLCLGGGLSLGSNNNFEIGARLNYGLLDMYPDYPTKGGSKRNYNIGGAVTLAYLFGSHGEEKEIISQEIIQENNEKTNEMRAEQRPEPKPQPRPEPRPEIKPEVKPEFEHVYFDLNKANIKTSESNKIDAAVIFLKENPSYNVRLVGYADKATGSAQYNLNISKRRVEAVKKYMIGKSIAASRIATSYEGDKIQPETENDHNRCVTIFVSE